ncbi:MAG: 3-deoxy-D-manno-octulosonic acid transferase [Paracoccaceae bacterium]
MPAQRTLLLRLYRFLTRVAGGFAYRHVAKKLRANDVPETRVAEKMGRPSLPRPNGRLIWFHAASVGESLSVLTLIRRLGERDPDLNFLMTSGTATSAVILAKRLPPQTQHQFAPLDTPAAVTAFYDHWQPDAGVFVESEIWPNLLLEGQVRGIPLALLNARMSEASVRGWQKWPKTAQAVLGCFSVLIAQNAQNQTNLIAMGAPQDRVRPGTNLKAMSAPLPVDQDALADLQAALGARPHWVASSTHEGEEAIVLDAHMSLLKQHPDLCLILIPRHPERGDTVADLISEASLSHARRSRGEALSTNHNVYLADTLGETGTFYAASPIVFVAGSLKPIGGHNPFEPAQMGAALITGPHRANFAETYDALLQTNAVADAADAPALAGVIDGWLTDPTALEQARAAARAFVAGQDQALDRVVDTLDDALGLTHG